MEVLVRFPDQESARAAVKALEGLEVGGNLAAIASWTHDATRAVLALRDGLSDSETLANKPETD